jgi:hypothetical protein
VDAATVTNIIAGAGGIVSAIALVVAILAKRTAQSSLYVAYRPYLSIDLYAIEGTGPIILNFASVFHNHGNVPATVTGACSQVTGRGDAVIAAGSQLHRTRIRLSCASSLAVTPS